MGYPSIAVGLGDYEGGKLRVEGSAPTDLRSHAVVFDGLKTHSSSKLNGDRWSLVLCVHASWDKVPAATASELRQYGLPCPPTCQTAAPAPTDGPPLLAKAGAVLATIPEGEEEEEVLSQSDPPKRQKRRNT